MRELTVVHDTKWVSVGSVPNWGPGGVDESERRDVVLVFYTPLHPIGL